MFKTKLREIVIRVLARAVDWALFLILFMGIFKLANADFEMLNGGMFAVVFVLSWLLAEVALFMVFGNTPGKWFLGVKVTKADGEHLSKLDIVLRTIGLFVLGFGIGYPYVIVVAWLVNLVAMLVSDKTLYDKVGKYSIKIVPVSKLRFAILGFVMIAFIVLIVAQGTSGQPPEILFGI